MLVDKMATNTGCKRSHPEDVDLALGGSKKQIKQTDYSKCILCQESKRDRISTVIESSVKTLREATEARQDDTALRLKSDLSSATFILDRHPQWHQSCRNLYCLKKSYELAEKKRINRPEPEGRSEAENALGVVRRSSIVPFDAKTMCVICSKIFDKDGRKPTSLVETGTRQKSLMDKASQLQDNHLLARIRRYDKKPIDMVANDVCYHMKCMNRYLTQRAPSSSRTNVGESDAIPDPYDEAFLTLVSQIDNALFSEMSGYLLSSLRDKYRHLLLENGVESPDSYPSRYLKKQLDNYYGSCITFLPQTSGSDFVCSSSVSIGNALANLMQLMQNSADNAETPKFVLKAARTLRDEAKLAKSHTDGEMTIDFTDEAVEKIIPDSILNFVTQLLCEKNLVLDEGKVIIPDEALKEKSLMLAQHLLYAICGMRTPLTIATAFHIYNETRSKDLITLMNRLNISISYDTFHRLLTNETNKVLEQETGDGVYIPPNMSKDVFTHFAFDNIDWHERTLDGTTFHATSAITIQPCTSPHGRGQFGISVPHKMTRSKTITHIPNKTLSTVILTKKRQKDGKIISRNLFYRFCSEC